MATSYYIGQDNLIAGTVPAPDPTGVVEVSASQGILERGTLIVTDKEIKNGKPIGNSLNGSTGEVGSVFVLTDDIDTDEAEAPIFAQAYVAGNFALDHLITEEGYTLTQADIQLMRRFNLAVSGTIDPEMEVETDAD